MEQDIPEGWSEEDWKKHLQDAERNTAAHLDSLFVRKKVLIENMKNYDPHRAWKRPRR